MAKKAKAKPTGSKLGALVDQLYELRARRLEMAKGVEELKKAEIALRTKLLKTVPKSELTGARGRKGQVNLIPDVYSKWAGEDGKDRFLKHLRKTGQFDLIVFHVNTAAAKERWAEKVVIPGIMPEPYTKLSVTKI